MSTLGQDNGKKWSSLEFGQVDENDPAQLVVLHEPCLPNWMGSIHPNGSLYELPVDIKKAQKEHENFRRELEKNGCQVKTVKEILLMDCDSNLVSRIQLEDFAFKNITYRLVDTDPATLTETDRYYLSDEYKRECLDKMNEEQLVEIILTHPTIDLRKADKNTELLAVNYSYQPLVNLVFTRDQQLTTAKGIVMASLASSIRAREVEVMKFCFEKLGLKPIGQVPLPGTIEGGDFFPVGKDLCFIGVGLRTNMAAVNYMMTNDLFGTKRVAVVKDYFDQDQQRMHLDTMCNIIGRKCALILDITMGAESPLRRLVDEYTQDMYGIYHLTKHDVEFSQYLLDEGYSLIPITDENQRNYGCNCLNIGNGTIIAVDKTTSKTLAKSPYFDGKISVIDFRNMSNMYGSVHCCSQVVSRKRAQVSGTQDALRLLVAVNSGDLETVRSLAHTTDVNVTDYDQRTPLHIACSSKKPVIVNFLLNEGVAVNVKDRWGKTPLDDAISADDAESIALLRKIGAVTAEELAQKINQLPHSQIPPAPKPRNKQLSSRVVMVAPNNFHASLTEDNMWMKNSINLEFEFERVKGRRHLIESALKEFATLHKVITSFGVECFLFSHDNYMDAPESVFVQDWFSTHPPGDIHADGTLVVYAMKNPVRRREKREELIEFLRDMYPHCLNFSPCENGKLEVSNEPHLPHNAEDVGEYLEYGALVLDREHKLAFCVPSKRCSLPAAQMWANTTGYKLIDFETKDYVHHADLVLTVGSNFVLICYDVIKTETDRQKVKEALLMAEKASERVIVEVTVDQMKNFCANAIELCDQEGRQLVILSSTAYNSLEDHQLDLLRSKVQNLVHVNVSTLETVGGGCISTLINHLF